MFVDVARYRETVERTLRLLGALACMLVVASPFICEADAAERIALVIGNQSYEHVPVLANPRNDAVETAKLLDHLGFQVQRVLDGNHAELSEAFQGFVDRARNAEVALFYFAGHGFQHGGKNYLAPRDFAPARIDRDTPKVLRLDRVLNRLERLDAVKLVVLDACRDNPMAEWLAEDNATAETAKSGLARPHGGGVDTFIAFATAPGKVAFDGTGDHSPFTRAFLRHAGRSGQTIDGLMRRVRVDVMRTTTGQQVPWSQSSLSVKLTLRPGDSPDVSTTSNSRSIRVNRKAGRVKIDRRMYLRRASPVRVRPEPDAGVLRELEPGRNVKVIALTNERKRAWYQIELPGGGRGFLPFAAVTAAQPDGEPAPRRSDEPAGSRRETVTRDCLNCPEMVRIPAGTFRMGSSRGDSDELPVRKVRVTTPFAISKHEITFAAWDACVAGGGCNHRPDDNGWGRGRHPVINVSFEDARAYARWLSGETGRDYRLPTAAEWEYVAKAGQGADSSGTGRANCSGCSSMSKRRTIPVGQLEANAFGVHDMRGNVAEWVQDCQTDSYRLAGGTAAAAVRGRCARRGVRGGSWYDRSSDVRPADRTFEATYRRAVNIGIRVVRDLQ